jgi:predicted nucleotidyltransferase
MKFDKPLDDIFGAPSNVKVLRVLARIDWELTGRQIADMAGLNAMTCQNTLNRLREFELLGVRRVGSANLYSIVRDKHLTKNLILPLFRRERELLPDALNPTVEAFSRIASEIHLFGSTARGEAGYGSDLDVCVIVRNKSIKEAAEDITDQETNRLSRLTGILPTILVWTEREFKDRLKRKDALAWSIVEGRTLYPKQ